MGVQCGRLAERVVALLRQGLAKRSRRSGRGLLFDSLVGRSDVVLPTGRILAAICAALAAVFEGCHAGVLQDVARGFLEARNGSRDASARGEHVRKGFGVQSAGRHLRGVSCACQFARCGVSYDGRAALAGSGGQDVPSRALDSLDDARP